MRNKILVIGMTGLAIVMMACGGNNAQPTSAPPTVAAADTVAAPTEVPAHAVATEVPPTEAAPTEAAATEPTATQASSAGSGSGQGVPIGDIKTILNNACAAMKAQPNLNVHSVIAGDSAADILLEIVGQERMHEKLSSPKSNYESIIVPEGAFQNEKGTWTKLPVVNAKLAQSLIIGARSAAGLFICFNDSKNPASSLSAKITGLAANIALPEVVDGAPCLVYNVTVSVDNGANGHGTGKATYWLGVTDSIPHKATLSYSGVNKDNKPISGEFDSSYSYQAADIQAPIK